MSSLKEAVDLRLNDADAVLKIYTELLGEEPRREKDTEYKFHSPFTNERTGSFGVDPTRQGLYKCFSSGKGGNIYTFLKEAKGIEKPLLWLADRFQIKPDDSAQYKLTVPLHDVNKAYEYLKLHPEKKELLFKKGFTEEYIEKHKIGYRDDEFYRNRYWIPILDEADDIVDVRMYDPENSQPGLKTIHFYKYLTSISQVPEKIQRYLKTEEIDQLRKGHKVKLTGFGKARLYSFDQLAYDTVCIMEGERDKVNGEVKLNKFGIGSVCVTGGADSWSMDFNKKFKGKTVYIVTDNDEAGERGGIKKAQNLFGIAKEIRVIKFDPINKKGYDFSDYMVDHTPEEFIEYCKQSIRFDKVEGANVNNTEYEIKNKKDPRQYAEYLNTKFDFIFVMNQCFYQYVSAGHWQAVDDLIIEKYITELVEQHGGIYKPTFIMAIFKRLMMICKEERKPEEAEGTWMNVENGLIDIKTRTLQPHSKAVFITTQRPIKFQPTAACPKWIKFIEQVISDPDSRMAIQEYFGYCLTTDVSQQKALCVIGTGSNGKSVMLKILEFLVGKTNCSAVAFNELGNSFSRSQLHGKLLNIGSEVEFNSVTSSGYFKQIVSGDTISAQEKYKPEFIFNPFCKLVFSSNDFPMTKDKTHGYYRRWILIIMDRIFGPNEQNHNLLNELKEELPGILNWALDGLERLHKQGRFTESAKINATIQGYKESANPIMLFVGESCKVESDKKQQRKTFIDAYKEYCRDNGYMPLSTQRITKELHDNYGIQVVKSHGIYYYVGIYVESSTIITAAEPVTDIDKELISAPAESANLFDTSPLVQVENKW